MRLDVATLVVLALMGAGTSAAAQRQSPISAGGWIIGGTAGLSRSHDNTSDVSTTSAYLSPLGLRFVVDRFAVGGSVLLSYGSGSAGHSSSVGLGPSARYYFGDPAGNVFPFLSATVAPQWADTHTKTVISGVPIASDGSSRVLTVDGSAGLTGLLAANVGLTGEAFYTHTSFHTTSAIVGDRGMYNLGVRFGLTVFVR